MSNGDEDDDENEGPKPNKWGVTAWLTFDRFDEWKWDGQDAITDISARAARLVIEEIEVDSRFWLVEKTEEGGIAVEMCALDGDLIFEADLLGLVREFMRVHDREMDRVKLRRVLTAALALLDTETDPSP